MIKHKHSFFAIFLLFIILFYSIAEAGKPDKTAPSVPTGLTANAGSCSQVNLSWSASTDERNGSGLKGYYVYRGSAKQNSTPVTSTAYSDTGLSALTPYSYQVTAVDNTGNESAKSSSASATTPACSDTTPPTVSITSPANNTTYTSAQTVIITASASDNVGVTKVEFYDGATLQGTDTASPYTYSWSITSANNGTHTWTAKAYDAAGNSSTSSGVSLTVNIASSTTPPLAPSDLTATALSSNQINLVWQDNSNNEDGFHVWRYHSSVGWTQIAVVGANTASYSDTGLSASTTYQYAVRAYNSAGVSSWSNTVPATTLSGTGDVTPPTGSITINGGATYANTASVTLTLSASDNSGSVSQMCISNASSCTAWETYAGSRAWALATGDGTKTVYVWYKDGAGNTSTSCSDTIILDTTPPSSSITINGGAAYTNTTSVTLTLSASDATSGVAQMCLSNTGTCTSWETYATSKAWTLTSGDGTKTVYVWYKDGAGNANTSAYSDTIILDMTAPPVPSGLTATAVSSSQINLSWSAVVDTTGGSGLAGYKVYRSVTQIGTTTATNYSDYGLTANTQYCYTVKSYDVAGNESGQCTQACATTQGSVSSGAYLWAQKAVAISSTYSAYAQSVTVDAGGNAIAEGFFSGSIDFGCGTLSSTGSSDIFIAKYSPTGSCQWSKHLGSSGSSAAAYSGAVDGSSNIVVTGYFSGSVDFGGGSLSSAGLNDIFIAKYSSTGAYLWAKRIGGLSNDLAYSITTDTNNNIIVTGYFVGSVDFGGGSLTSSGVADIFIAKYSPTGAHLWSKRLGGSGSDISKSIATDSGGDVVVTGTFQGTVDFGGGSLTSAGSKDIFVAKYSSAGAYIWSRSFGSSNDDYAYGVAVDGYGNVILTGTFIGTIDFGGGPMSPAGGGDIFLAKYSSTGQYIWAKHFGATSIYASIANAVATDANGNIALTGSILGNINFGSGYLFSNGTYDILLAKFSPDGVNLWSKRFGGDYDDHGNAVAVDDISGNVYMVGDFTASVDFGGGALTSQNTPDAFIAIFAP